MELTAVVFNAPLAVYDRQAAQLLAGFNAGDADAVRLFWHKHPRFLDAEIPWLAKRMTEEEVREAPLDHADAQLALARWYDFADWQRLIEYVESVTADGSPVALFESAVEAVVTGDESALRQALHEHPDLVRSRSTRVTHFEPPVHGATLLHYVAANGVEEHRQKTPANAVEIAKTLLDAGANPDALAGMYGGQATTMSMLVSSAHPRAAGMQIPLVDVLLDYGAAVDGAGVGDWVSPLMTALAFGYEDVAETLVQRGARADTLPAVAGLGRLRDAERLLAAAGGDERHRALVLAAQHGHVEIVRLLLEAGEDPNRYNPRGNHGHSTPLHQAVWAGHDAVVRLLVERGARLDISDTIYHATPLGWAEYAGRAEIAQYLRSRGTAA
ncbi:MAG: ankyrin repeat domain-containing protein [Acidobacteriota bacterium]